MSSSFNQPLNYINSFNNINNYDLNNNNYIINNYENSYKSPIPNFNYQSKFFTEKKMNFINNNMDSFQKMKEDKYNEIIKTQKNTRFLAIYKKKIVDNQNNLNLNNSNEEVFIDDYIKLIKEIYQDKNNYLNYIAQRGFYNFSSCPFCGDPVVFICDRVLCVNKCFRTSVASETFDENYTLDNFMEQYRNYYSRHLNCKDDLMTLYVDKESKCAEFLCYKCEKNFINFN